jgi:CRP-like cAMP-binding protein
MVSPPRNGILQRLPPAYLESLLTRMEVVDLPVPTYFYRGEGTPRYAHFMTSGVASAVANTRNGTSIEVGLTGREGLVEANHLLGPAELPPTEFMLVEGAALRISFGDLQREVRTCEALRLLVLRSVQTHVGVMGQMIACNRLHGLQRRLARWLLMVQDKLGENRFTMTHELLSHMIGVRRSSITVAAGNLQRMNLIGYHWGQIEILDREGLLQAACECYAVVDKLTRPSLILPSR